MIGTEGVLAAARSRWLFYGENHSENLFLECRIEQQHRQLAVLIEQRRNQPSSQRVARSLNQRDLVLVHWRYLKKLFQDRKNSELRRNCLSASPSNTALPSLLH